MGLRDLVYRLYERRLEASLSGHSVPRHVGVILDGNRRWARSVGLADVSSGHQRGADHIFELLGWCRQVGVEVVTLWLLSTDNLERPAAEVEALLRIIEATVRGLAGQGWHVKPVGALDLLPAETAQVLKDAAEATAANPGLLVNVAIGYGGRREIADAVRSLLHDHATRGTSIEELAEILDVEHIADHLATRTPRAGPRKAGGTCPRGRAKPCCAARSSHGSIISTRSITTVAASGRDKRSCVRAQKEFTIKGTENCLARGFDRTGFFEVDTGDQRAWTVQLTESRRTASTARAGHSRNGRPWWTRRPSGHFQFAGRSTGPVQFARRYASGRV